MTRYRCTKCGEIVDKREIMADKHLTKSVHGKQTTLDLCGPVTIRQLAICGTCGDPIWGKVYEIRGSKTCGRCFKDNEREKAD